MENRTHFVNTVISTYEALDGVKEILSSMNGFFGLNMDIDSVSIDSTLSELGMDSLDAVDLIMRIENKYCIAIPMDYDMNTVRDAVNIILKLAKK